MKKRITGILLTSSLLIIAFTGCGKKNVDYEIGGSQGGSRNEKLKDVLAIPESCDISIDVGESGLASIKIIDDEIEIPETPYMSVVYFKKLNSQDDEQGYKQKLAETLLEKVRGIYVYKGKTKSELEEEIAYYSVEREKALSNGEEETWLCDTYIEDLKMELETAPDEHQPAGDYSADHFLGVRNNMDYILAIDQFSGGLYIENNNPIQYRPYEGAMSVSINWGDAFYDNRYEEETEENTCEILEEQAVTLAEAFLNTCGITDLEATKTENIIWHYQNASAETVAVEHDGYVVTFDRMVNHISVFNETLSWVDNLSFDNVNKKTYLEQSIILVDANGVLEASWDVIFAPTGEEDKNVKLLSWDELIAAVNANLSEYYTKYPTNSYQEITFNDVSLCYYMVADDRKENSYQCIPVWVFAEKTKFSSDSPMENLIQLAIINAMDGNVIDLIEQNQLKK